MQPLEHDVSDAAVEAGVARLLRDGPRVEVDETGTDESGRRFLRSLALLAAVVALLCALGIAVAVMS